AGSAAARRSPPISRRPPPLDPLAEERWILENIYVPSGGEAPYSSPLSEKPEVEFTASRAPAHRGRNNILLVQKIWNARLARRIYLFDVEDGMSLAQAIKQPYP
ncbi:unnamed protein product, partial [Musa hybrid cultivar]